MRNRDARMKLCGDLDDLLLPHAVDEEIGAAFQENGWAHLITPIVVMRHAAQTRFNAADDDGNASPSLAQPFRINSNGTLRTAVHASAGRISILAAQLLCRREATELRIEIAARYKKGKPRLA